MQLYHNVCFLFFLNRIFTHISVFLWTTWGQYYHSLTATETGSRDNFKPERWCWQNGKVKGGSFPAYWKPTSYHFCKQLLNFFNTSLHYFWLVTPGQDIKKWLHSGFFLGSINVSAFHVFLTFFFFWCHFTCLVSKKGQRVYKWQMEFSMYPF